jgi:gamma-glutamylcyclotransferase (GGCT)/AIG2-like uncharacterized protein YtfP
MNKFYYFGYGMNTNSSGMAARCPGAVSLGHAILPGHEFRFASHADVLEDPRKEVHGVLWEINDTHLASLDNLEGYPYYYLRKEVEVLHNGKKVNALVYYMVDGHYDDYPSTGYYDVVTEGYIEHGVPTKQLFEALKTLKRFYGPNDAYSDLTEKAI